MFLPPRSPSRVHCGRPHLDRPLFSRQRVRFERGNRPYPKCPPDITDINDQMTVLRENLRELIEQAAAYTGAADDELVAQRIADQETRLALLTRRRNELSERTRPKQGERYEEEPHHEEHGDRRGRRSPRRNGRSR